MITNKFLSFLNNISDNFDDSKANNINMTAITDNKTYT